MEFLRIEISQDCGVIIGRFHTRADYPSETDNLSSKSVKIDG